MKCEKEIKARIAMLKQTFNEEKNIFCGLLTNGWGRN